MATEILEREEPEAAPPVTEAVEPAEAQNQPAVEPETPTQGEQEPEITVQAEPEIEIAGEKVKVSQIAEWRKDAENKKEWQKTNTLKAQETARRAKELEEAEAIYKLVQKDPTKLQKLLQPEPERDFDTELNAMYQNQPDPLDRENFIRWEFQKDQLLALKASERGYKQAVAQESQKAMKSHNDSVINQAYDKYREKVSDEEFREMAEFVHKTIQPVNGMYPESSFDIAYKVRFGERDVETAKLSAAKAVGESIRKARPASGEQGSLPKPEHKSPSDIEDDAFSSAVKERFGSAR